MGTSGTSGEHQNSHLGGILSRNQCYNAAGMTAMRATGTYLVSFHTAEVLSALLSLMLAPLSAYFGGKLIGVPYVK